MSVLLVIREEKYQQRLELFVVRVAAARADQAYIVHLSEGSSIPDVSDIKWQDEQVKVTKIESSNPYRTIRQLEEVLNPQILILNDAVDSTEQTRKIINQAIDEVRCELMVVRMGDGEDYGDKILVACSGGRHSKVALKLAYEMEGKGATAFYVEPDVDDVSETVGFSHIHRYLNRAGVPDGEMRCEVGLANNVFEGIHNEVTKNEYGLVMIGASGYSTVRKRLFGTVPEKLMRGEKGMSVCVVRAALPIKSILSQKFERLLHLNVPQLKRDERVALFDDVEEKSRWSFDFAALMILATSIASFGLLSNSAAVVIGAMLVAPLMMPLLGGGLSLVQGNWPLWKRCQSAVLLGFLSALTIGAILGFIARVLDMPLTSELAARGEPSLLDLGIAFLSGVAASYCVARPKLGGALAGVAIAAALVPPIATTGICLVLGEFPVARGAALLFGTNVVAIVLGAAFNFYLAGIRGRKKAEGGLWSQRFLIVLTLVMAGLLVPLTSVLIERIAGPVEIEEVLTERAEDFDLHILRVQRSKHLDGLPLIDITVESAMPVTKAVMLSIKQAIEEKIQGQIHLRIKTILIIRNDE